jgi:tRNA threonylcarbamoyl adenosine modification protein YeaZ
MLILAFDTTLAACSAAVFDGDAGRLLAHAFEPLERGHAEALVGMVRGVLEESAVELARVDRIAVTVGPGTFTGVRIGLSLARGLRLALGTPVCGLTSLEAMRLNVDDNPERRAVASLIDARRGEYYLAAWSAEGALLVAPCAVRHEDAAGLLPAGSLVVGTGADRLVEFAGGTGDVIRAGVPDLPDAARIAEAAIELAPAPEPPQPLYLRPPGARPPIRSPGKVSVIEVTAAQAALMSALHAECFEDAWSADDIARLMAVPGAIALIALVAPEINPDRPAGFVLARRAADEAEIISIGTGSAFRRRGVARALVGGLTKKLKAAGARSLFIEVAARNDSAQALYRALGFTAAGVRRGYYAQGRDGAEDAIVMRLAL